MNAQSTTERLQALIDGELDPAEAARVFRDIDRDPGLREELADLQKLKYLVCSAYADVGVDSAPIPGSDRGWRYAAVAVVVLCLTAGWIARDLMIELSVEIPGERVAALVPAVDPAVNPAVGQAALAVRDDRVLVHLDKPDPTSWKVALDSVERLLSEDPARASKVELLVNSGGINLLQAGGTPYTERVRELARRYPNLTLFACARGMERLREKGIDVHLIDQAHTASSALEHVVDRLNNGWRYVGI
jgi:intracellular sulfur oxidation DsrE/DsrF family protein